MYTGESPYRSPPKYSYFIGKDTNAVQRWKEFAYYRMKSSVRLAIDPFSPNSLKACLNFKNIMGSQPDEEKTSHQNQGWKVAPSQISLFSLTMFQIQTSKCELWLGVLREQENRDSWWHNVFLASPACTYTHTPSFDIFCPLDVPVLGSHFVCSLDSFCSNISFLKNSVLNAYVVILFQPDISFLFMMNRFEIFLSLLLVTILTWHIVT